MVPEEEEHTRNQKWIPHIKIEIYHNTLKYNTYRCKLLTVIFYSLSDPRILTCEFVFVQTNCITFRKMWNNDTNLLATTPPNLTPLIVDESYYRKEQPPLCFCRIAASLLNCKQVREWHADVAKLMPFTMRYPRPRWMVRPYITLNLRRIHQSLVPGQL